jgi:uncharacterized membrane protein (DUF4010 family)
MPTPSLTLETLALLLGLSFFFGLSFEGFYWKSARSRPGGIRTFPLLSVNGAILYALEPHFAAAFCAGLLVLGAWLYPYYRAEVASSESGEGAADGIMVPLCNVVAYVLGPVALLEEPWVAIGLTVAAVLLLRARDRLHALARRIPSQEIITLAQFLILTGVILPLLPNEPVTSLTPITPFQVWLAVVVVSTLSYGSYLLQQIAPWRGSMLATSVLGGLYSSTATTVVLARNLRQDPGNAHELQSGIVLATALMYARLGIVVGVFDFRLARTLAVPLLLLAFAAAALASACLWWGRRGSTAEHAVATPPRNPLELPTAAVFAALFVLVSVVSTFVEVRFGRPGVFSLAALVGFTDIDPFVLSIAQGSVAGIPPSTAAVAIVIAASSNNALKAAYALAFAGWRYAATAAISLLVLGIGGAMLAFGMERMVG